jgi:hypothetical protein
MLIFRLTVTIPALPSELLVTSATAAKNANGDDDVDDEPLPKCQEE